MAQNTNLAALQAEQAQAKVVLFGGVLGLGFWGNINRDYIIGLYRDYIRVYKGSIGIM